jgi:hypothetical protein
MRNSDNFSDYDDISIDFIMSYKINKNWYFNLLNRHFFIPDGGDRQFWFIDLGYKTPISSKLTFSNALRYHIGVNWNRTDANFIRYQPKISYNAGKFTPFIATDLFYRVEDTRTLSGSRNILGVDYGINKWKFSFHYWYQVVHNDEYPIPESNFIILNLAYTLN